MLRELHIVLLCLLTCLSCRSKETAPAIMDEATFVHLYCDVIGTSDRLPRAQRSAFVDSILATYGVTTDVFKNTIDHYNQDPQRWHHVFEAITKELENRLRQTDGATGKNAKRSPKTEKPVTIPETSKPALEK